LVASPVASTTASASASASSCTHAGNVGAFGSDLRAGENEVSRGQEERNEREREANLEQTTTEHGLVKEDGVGDERRLGELDVGVSISSEKIISKGREEAKDEANAPLWSGVLVKEDGDTVDGTTGSEMSLDLLWC
jgi:hypothetical protein